MKNIIVLLVLVSFFSSCSDNNFTIKGTMDGVNDGRMIYLKSPENKSLKTIDSVLLKNGKFSFSGKIEEPTYFGIIIDSIRQGIFPLVDIGNKVSIEVFKDSLMSSKITGSPLQTKLNELYETKKELSRGMNSYFTEFQQARKDNDTTKIKFINKKIREIQTTASLNDWNFVKNNPDSPLSSLLIGGLMRDPMFKDSCKIGYENLSDKIRNSKLAAPLKDFYEGTIRE